MIPHLTYFPFLQNRTLTVCPCCNLPVFCSWDMMTFAKNHAGSIIFCPSSDQQNLREKLIASAKYQTGTIGNDGVPQKALEILPALFHGWSTTRLLHRKIYPCATVLLCCTTVLQYFKLLIPPHCSVPGTDSCNATTVLYCCTTAVLLCTTVLNCTDVLYYYSTVVYQVLHYCCTWYDYRSVRVLY